MSAKFDFSNAEGIRKSIKSVCGRAATLQADIQQVALACLEHTINHGDWTLSRDLIEGISASKGVKFSSLKQWFEAFMHASYTEDGDGNPVFVYDEGKGQADISLEQAKVVMWYDFKPPKRDTSKTLEDIRDSVAKMLKTSLKKGKVDEYESDTIMEVFATLIEAREAEAENMDRKTMTAIANELSGKAVTTATTTH